MPGRLTLALLILAIVIGVITFAAFWLARREPVDNSRDEIEYGEWPAIPKGRK